MAEFVLGVNYWPRRSAMYMWERLDLGEVREDAAHARELGLQAVRFFLRWDRFQPRPDALDGRALDDLVRVMDAFAGAGLLAMPTLFCGHMSGVNWLPSWTLDRQTPHGRFRTMTESGESPYGIGDFYADPRLLAAQALFAREAARTLRGHPALAYWDVGNEFSNMREPGAPADAAAWSARLAETLHECSDAGVGVTGGMHGEDIERDRKIRPSSIAAPWSIATMHGYSAYSVFSRGAMDVNVVPYLARLIGDFTQKPLLFSEFGNPACPQGATTVGGFPCLDEEQMPRYARTVLDRLHAGGAIGAYWWCWSDYAPQLAELPPFDRAPHELRFGLLRDDGSEKPVARELAAFAAEHRAVADTPLGAGSGAVADTPLGATSGRAADAPLATSGRVTDRTREPIADEAEYYAGLPESCTRTYERYCETHD